LLGEEQRNVPLAIAHLVRACRTNSHDRLGRALLYRALLGAPRALVFKHAAAVQNATFSPDGKRLLTVCEDNAAHLWDVSHAREIGEPLRHEGL